MPQFTKLQKLKKLDSDFISIHLMYIWFLEYHFNSE